MLPAAGKKGVMAAWELRLADYSVESFDDMTVLDFRQLFADREFEPGMMQLEVRIYSEIGETEAEGGGRGGQGRRGQGEGCDIKRRKKHHTSASPAPLSVV